MCDTNNVHICFNYCTVDPCVVETETDSGGSDELPDYDVRHSRGSTVVEEDDVESSSATPSQPPHEVVLWTMDYQCL